MKKQQPVKAQPKEPVKKPQAVEPQVKQKPEVEVQIIPEPLPLPNITIHNIIELQQAPMRAIILSDAQIQLLSMDEIVKRHKFLQETLANVLDYDVVISDTNVWLELLFGKAPSGQTAAGGDAKPAAQPQRLLYERQLEFISKMCAYRGGRFMMMSETYEEIDRFACLLDPQNYKDADFSDNSVCLNAAARLAKRLILQQSLRRLAGQELEVPLPLPSPTPLHYRNRAVLHYDGTSLCFYNGRSHQPVPVTSCQLLRPELNDLLALVSDTLPASGLPELRGAALRCSADGQRLLLTFICHKRQGRLSAVAEELMRKQPKLISVWENDGPPVYSVYGEKWRLLAGAEKLRDQIGPVAVDLSPASFLQVNPGQTTALYDLVRGFAGLDGSQRVLDLYSGVGSIALYLAGSARQVWGVESYAPAAADAADNAALNGADNCRFETGRAEDILPRWAQQGRRFDMAVLDPPRAGCDKRLLDAVARMAPPRLVCVSCAPATLARDLPVLRSCGYAVEKLQPADMFPRTCHVETVCLLTHKG